MFPLSAQESSCVASVSSIFRGFVCLTFQEPLFLQSSEGFTVQEPLFLQSSEGFTVQGGVAGEWGAAMIRKSLQKAGLQNDHGLPIVDVAKLLVEVEKGTTIMVLILRHGVLLITDSRCTCVKTFLQQDNAAKFAEITPCIAVASAGLSYKAEVGQKRLQDVIRREEMCRPTPPNVYYTACTASQVLCNVRHNLETDHPSAMLVAGYDGLQGPSAYHVSDEPVFKRIESVAALGSGGVFAMEQLNCDGIYEGIPPGEHHRWIRTSDLSVEDAVGYVRRAYFHACLRDPGTGGVCSGYYIHSGGYELVLSEHMIDLYIDLYRAWPVLHTRALFLLSGSGYGVDFTVPKIRDMLGSIGVQIAAITSLGEVRAGCVVHWLGVSRGDADYAAIRTRMSQCPVTHLLGCILLNGRPVYIGLADASLLWRMRSEGPGYIDVGALDFV